MPNKSIIEVVISTLNDGLLNIRINSSFHYLIVHQITDTSKLSLYKDFMSRMPHKNIRYIQSFEIGLSKSRNIGINNAQGDYLWIMDDDVTIHDDAKFRIQPLLLNNIYDLIVLNYSSDLSLTNNKIKKKLNCLSSTSVSSINMLIKRESIGNIRFDESFGLGTQWPSGEEYIFCCDFLKAKRSIWQSDLIVAYHPPLTSGQDFFSTPIKLATKKHMFRRALGYSLGSVFYTLFILKKLPIITKNRSLKNILKSFII